MALQHEFQRCLPDDPRRCQAGGTREQCPFKAVDGHSYCRRHMATSEHHAARRAAAMFRLGQYQERVNEFTTNNELKNLRAEIGILRMVLEEIITQTGGDKGKLLCYSGKISDTIMKIGILVKTCQRLDVQMGLMLDRDKIMLIGQRIVEIVAETVPDPEILDRLGDQLVQAILEVSSQ